MLSSLSSIVMASFQTTITIKSFMAEISLATVAEITELMFSAKMAFISSLSIIAIIVMLIGVEGVLTGLSWMMVVIVLGELVSQFVMSAAKIDIFFGVVHFSELRGGLG